MAGVAYWSGYPLPGMRLLSFIGVDFHWDILQYVLGLPFMTFLALLLYLRSRDEDWMRLARTLAKGFILVFAVGAATGTASEFGLVLLWPNLTEAAGRYIYFPLYMEIFAFMMEVIFLYMLWYGWNRISHKGSSGGGILRLPRRLVQRQHDYQREQLHGGAHRHTTRLRA